MTAIQVYEAVLTELNKVKAPSLSLLDFIYFFNKAVLQYMNLMYNAYEINQQKVDDLRVVKSTAILDVHLSPHLNSNPNLTGFFNNIYEVDLPDDYWHILNCIVKFADLNKGGCNSLTEPEQYIIKNPQFPEETKVIYSYDTFFVGAKRLTSDASPLVINNFYFKPSYKNPYYYINTVNESNNLGSININESLNLEVPKYIIPVCKDYSSAGELDIKWFSKLEFKFKNGTDSSIIVSLEDLDTSIDREQPKSILFLYRILLKLKNQIKISNLLDLSKLSYFKNMKINLIDEEHLEVSSLDLIGLEAFSSTLDQSGTVIYSKLPSYILTSKNNSNFLVDKESYVRYGNSQKTKMEIRYGENKNIIPVKVLIDYLKAPLQINLTEDLINDVEDNSQIIEFPDYVVYEIINNLVKLILENTGSPRINTTPIINTTIGGISATK